MAAVEGPAYAPSPASPVSPSRRDRPLPTPPMVAPRPRHPPNPEVIPSMLSSVAAGKRKAHSIPSIIPQDAVRQMLGTPTVLARLILHMPWSSFHALMSTCREHRRIFYKPQLRDAILERYVPGYRLCLGNRDVADFAIDITTEDLAIFQMSQNVPLHIYPMHALTILNSPLYIPDIQPTDPYTTKLVEFAQAHSRFVLLLQSLVHSGFSVSSPMDSDDFALWSTSEVRQPIMSGVRELVFPKPLSFFDPSSTDRPSRDDTLGTRSKNDRRTSSEASHFSRSSSVDARPRASAEFHSLPSKLTRNRNRLKPVLSVFGGGPRVPPPPPSARPPGLSFYSGGWRRTLVKRRSGYASGGALSDEDEEPLPRPKFLQRRSASLHRSPESSVGSSSPSSSRSNAETDYNTDASSVAPRDGTKPVSSYGAALTPSPSFALHDIGMATSRFRAPILRVFVPCSQLDEVAIAACEEQLMNAGLWNQLSAGDIVCNFGFVPPPEEDNSSQSSCALPQSARPKQRRRWLMFNGYCLVHYIPPSPPPVDNSLTLPSPFYFSHILPPLSDPRFILSMPPLSGGVPGSRSPRSRAYAADPYAQLSLSHVRTRVVSPHSPGGFAIVKKYIWLARIPYVGPNSRTEAGAALGEGWQGEWILETEGTKEGRQTLLDAVNPDSNGSTPRGLWEVVRDKSSYGRLWMRLVAANIDSQRPELAVE